MPIDLVTAITAKALDGLYVRQTATAQNIANANSANYAPVRVSFEAELRDAAAPHMNDSDADRLARVRAVTARIDTSLPIESNAVRLDNEITAASETSARYAMLIGMLDRTMQLRQLAIKGA
ncbi:flagellar basal body rod protein FlgB [Burkholderia sp. PU8-34]